MTDNPDPAEILRVFARELLCQGDHVRALLTDQPGAADALLAAAAQKLLADDEEDRP